MYTKLLRFTRIYPVCSTYELTKQFMKICVKNCPIDLKKNNLYTRLSTPPFSMNTPYSDVPFAYRVRLLKRNGMRMLKS